MFQLFSIAAVIVYPPMALNIAVAVVLLAIGYATLSFKVQRIVIDRAKMKENQQKMQHHFKKIKELTDANQDATEHQNAYMAIVKESTQNQFKLMAVMLPMFFAVYYVALPALFWKVSTQFFMLLVPLGYAGLFIVAVMISGFVLLGVEKFFASMMTKKLQEMQNPDAQSNPEVINK